VAAGAAIIEEAATHVARPKSMPAELHVAVQKLPLKDRSNVDDYGTPLIL